MRAGAIVWPEHAANSLVDEFACCPSRVVAGGHYTADVLQGEGRWLRFNDAVVDMVSEKTVLLEKPYLLFYQRVHASA